MSHNASVSSAVSPDPDQATGKPGDDAGKKSRRAVPADIAAITSCDRALEDLEDPAARRRVLAFLNGKYGSVMPTPPPGWPPAATTPPPLGWPPLPPAVFPSSYGVGDYSALPGVECAQPPAGAGL